MKKKLITAALTATMALSMSMTALAGQWTNDSIGWHYDKTGYGNFAANEWLWIDGNNDGIAECYCFDGTSFMYANTTTPDGYTVNENGAWTVNGVVQTQQVGQTTATENTFAQTVHLKDLEPVSKKSFETWGSVRTVQGDLCSDVCVIANALVNDCYVEYYAGKQYNSLTMTVAAKQGWNPSATFILEVYGDDDTLLYRSNELNYKTKPFDVFVDISGNDYVKIVSARQSNGIGGIILKNADFH